VSAGLPENGNIGSGGFPTIPFSRFHTYHFMTCRQKEINFLLTQGIGAAREQLKTTVDRLDDIGELERQRYGDSLVRWLDATA
jgi:hypothetical protein